MSTRQVELLRPEDGQLVEGTLYSGMAPTDLLLVERSWVEARNEVMREHIEREIERARWPQSLHWDWSQKASLLGRLEATGFGVELAGAWQGVMLTRTASYTARLAVDKGKPLVYIDFLEAAPWNWKLPDIERHGRFRGVGPLLFRVAVEQSLEEGFHGRVGLHSLPQSDGFYREAMKMTAVGRDENKQNLMYFELSRERAEQFMKGGE